jgi:hypothetical protein
MIKHAALLKQWFNDQLVELTMIYRGTDHEFTMKSWDDSCLNKGPTLVVIQSEHGRIFGGYTSKGWTSNKSEYVADDKAWIFSFDHQT